MKMEKPKQNKEKAAYVPSLWEMKEKGDEAYKEIDRKIKEGLYESREIQNKEGMVVAQEIVDKKTREVVFYNSFQRPVEMPEVKTLRRHLERETDD